MRSLVAIRSSSRDVAGIKEPLPTGRGQYMVANRNTVASPAGRDTPRMTSGPRPAFTSGTHVGLAFEETLE